MTWTIDIEHIAGILDGEAAIEPGLNAVRASNWQGKSSFIASIETALGVATPLTEGRDRGRVHLETPDRTVEVDLQRSGDRVVASGQPYLDDEYDAVRADLFACLDETNAVRQAVRNGENLESVLLEPLDFQNIDERIADLRRQRERVDSKLAQAEQAAERLPTVQEKVTRLEDELAQLRERYAALSEPNDDGSPAATRSDLAQARSTRQQAENRIERLERSIERTEERLTERREELEVIEVNDEADYGDALEQARADLSEVRRDKEVLQSVYSTTEMVLEEKRLDLVTDVDRELTGDTVACWTCGTETTRAAVEERLDALGERIAEMRGAVESARDRVENVEAKREKREQERRRRDDLQAEIADLEETLADHRESLESARERRDEADARVEELAESIDETVEAITDLESEIKYREAELDDARDELTQLEERADRRDDFEDQREGLDEEITELRNRKDRITYEAREAFETAMQAVLSRFDTGFETARLTAEFDIVVARDGREASLDALSEGELELLGFVAALAGHESFDVAETVPVMLVDSVGGLDDDNLHTLIAYLRERTDYLVFTVYPEHASFDGAEIDPSEWDVATDNARADD